jgi:hypothetical protein
MSSSTVNNASFPPNVPAHPRREAAREGPGGVRCIRMLCRALERSPGPGLIEPLTN